MSLYLYTKKYTTVFPETRTKIIHGSVHKENLNKHTEGKTDKVIAFP